MSSLPSSPLDAAVWWEETGKPTISSFCQSFSCQLASQKFQTRWFFTRALELASSDWSSVGRCCCRLLELDAWAARGATVSAHVPLVADELAGVYHLATEGGWISLLAFGQCGVQFLMMWGCPEGSFCL